MQDLCALAQARAGSVRGQLAACPCRWQALPWLAEGAQQHGLCRHCATPCAGQASLARLWTQHHGRAQQDHQLGPAAPHLHLPPRARRYLEKRGLPHPARPAQEGLPSSGS